LYSWVGVPLQFNSEALVLKPKHLMFGFSLCSSCQTLPWI